MYTILRGILCWFFVAWNLIFVTSHHIISRFKKNRRSNHKSDLAMEYHVYWGSSSGCGNRHTAIRPPYLKNFKILPLVTKNSETFKLFQSLTCLLWKENITLKGKYYFERKILLWKESITLKGKYYFERKVLLWKESITLKGKYYFERKILLSVFTELNNNNRDRTTFGRLLEFFSLSNFFSSLQPFLRRSESTNCEMRTNWMMSCSQVRTTKKYFSPFLLFQNVKWLDWSSWKNNLIKCKRLYYVIPNFHLSKLLSTF